MVGSLEERVSGIEKDIVGLKTSQAVGSASWTIRKIGRYAYTGTIDRYTIISKTFTFRPDKQIYPIVMPRVSFFVNGVEKQIDVERFELAATSSLDILKDVFRIYYLSQSDSGNYELIIDVYANCEGLITVS